MALTGCASMPERPEVNIDQTTQEFKAALAQEMQRLEAAGVRARDRVARATRTVLAVFKETEETRRMELVAPLADALTKFERARGCWAYTLTTTQRGTIKNVPVEIITVEKFDPSQPRETAWTRVSTNGVTPDEQALANFRRYKMRKWRESMDRQQNRKSRAESIRSMALRNGIEVATKPDENSSYIIEQPAANFSRSFQFGGARREYVVDQATGELRSSRSTVLGPTVAFRPSFTNNRRIDYSDFRTEYAIIDPTLPPFPVRTSTEFRGTVNGQYQVGKKELVYSDYQQVTCFDDRFQVEFEELELLEFLPDYD